MDELPNPHEMPDYESKILEVVDVNSQCYDDLLYPWEYITDSGWWCMSIKIGGYFPWPGEEGDGKIITSTQSSTIRIVCNRF